MPVVVVLASPTLVAPTTLIEALTLVACPPMVTA